VAYYNRGSIWLDRGDKDRAIADYRQALKLNLQQAANMLKQLGVEP
jgi:tetratricopeptide (TPR) repeat protein